MSAGERLPPVTEADITEFKERGYWISPVFLDADEVAELRFEVERLMRGEKDTDSWGLGGPQKADPESKQMFQAVHAWWVNHRIRQTVCSPVIGYMASRLLEVDSVSLIHDQALVKPPLGESEHPTEGNFGWHQDFAYWDWISTSNLCTCWIALQDTDLSIGGIRTIVGSHKWGYDPAAETAGVKDLDVLREQYQKDGKEWIDEPCILKAGQASFHHSLTLHGSGPNRSDQVRMSVVSHLMPSDATYAASGKWNGMLGLLGPDAKDGDRLSGPLFPQTWPVE